MLPFLKWPGGKRWIAPKIAKMVKEHLGDGTYFEPFLGGGAVYFRLLPKRAVLSDINSDLVNTYRTVQNRADELIEAIKGIPVTSEDYYRLRALVPTEPLTQAARLLYLNRTAFAGMYRVNRSGQFNVPYGGGQRTPTLLWEDRLLEKASTALAGVSIQCSDFEPVIDQAGPGDVVYCDPTYTVAHDFNAFVRYNERNFSWADQQRLAGAAARACERGALVMVSNAHHPTVMNLYPDADMEIVERRSLISTVPDKRREVQECLFVLMPRS